MSATARTCSKDTLPFADGSFDVVLTNHAIEDVGSRSCQLEHSSEIGRVRAPDGVADLAVADHWAVIEQRFGPLPEPLAALLQSATSDQLETWGLRLLDADSLEQVFGPFADH